MSTWTKRIRIWLARRTRAYRRLEASRDAAVVTLALSVDTAGFAAGMASAARAVEQLHGRLIEISYQNRLRSERVAARRWWADYITSVYAEYGWEWPGQVGGGGR